MSHTFALCQGTSIRIYKPTPQKIENYAMLPTIWLVRAIQWSFPSSCISFALARRCDMQMPCAIFAGSTTLAPHWPHIGVHLVISQASLGNPQVMVGVYDLYKWLIKDDLEYAPLFWEPPICFTSFCFLSSWFWVVCSAFQQRYCMSLSAHHDKHKCLDLSNPHHGQPCHLDDRCELILFTYILSFILAYRLNTWHMYSLIFVQT